MLVLVTLIVAGVLDVASRGSTSPFGDDATAHDVRNRPLWLLARILLGVPVLGYFAYFRRSGQTPGMDLAGIRLVTNDGSPPGTARALLRSALTVAFAFATYLLWLDFSRTTAIRSTTPYRELYADPPDALVSAATFVVVAWLLGLLVAFVDGRRRSLWDRLVGLVQVDAVEQTRRDALFDDWLRRRGR